MRASPLSLVPALVAALLLLPPVSARAQDAAAVPSRNLFTAQPIGAMFGVFAADYERAVGTPGLTLGVGASYFDDGTFAFRTDGASFRYASAEAKARYYLKGVAFDGFSLGLTAGGAHARDNDVQFSATGIKIGTEVDYTRLLGRRKRLAIAGGVGGKRIFYALRADDAESARVNTAYLTTRLAIGWAF